MILPNPKGYPTATWPEAMPLREREHHWSWDSEAQHAQSAENRNMRVARRRESILAVLSLL